MLANNRTESEFEGCLYCFTCFRNGLSPYHRKFTKMLKPQLANFHDKGHIFSAHIDDIYMQGSNYVGCVDSLGFTVHPIKIKFLLKQIITCLGLVLSSRGMSIRFTDMKANKVALVCNYLLHTMVYTVRDIATFLGILV